jgi:glycopeptide antibiotics resistance protein
MNMLLLFPVGLFAMWLRPLVAVLSFALIGLVLPFAVEYAQYAFASLGRTCSFYDVGTNLLGLCVGFALGLAIRLLWVIGSRIVQWAR